MTTKRLFSQFIQSFSGILFVFVFFGGFGVFVGFLIALARPSLEETCNDNPLAFELLDFIEVECPLKKEVQEYPEGEGWIALRSIQLKDGWAGAVWVVAMTYAHESDAPKFQGAEIRENSVFRNGSWYTEENIKVESTIEGDGWTYAERATHFNPSYQYTAPANDYVSEYFSSVWSGLIDPPMLTVLLILFSVMVAVQFVFTVVPRRWRYFLVGTTVVALFYGEQFVFAIILLVLLVHQEFRSERQILNGTDQ